MIRLKGEREIPPSPSRWLNFPYRANAGQRRTKRDERVMDCARYTAQCEDVGAWLLHSFPHSPRLWVVLLAVLAVAVFPTGELPRA